MIDGERKAGCGKGSKRNADNTPRRSGHNDTTANTPPPLRRGGGGGHLSVSDRCTCHNYEATALSRTHTHHHHNPARALV